jgi:hypothetical protein
VDRQITVRRAARLRYYRAKDRTYSCQACQSLGRVPLLATGLAKALIGHPGDEETFQIQPALAVIAESTLDGLGLQLSLDDVKYFVDSDDEVLSSAQAKQFLCALGHERHPTANTEVALQGVAAKRMRQEVRSRNGISGAQDHRKRLDHVTAAKWRTGANRKVRQCEVCGKLLFAAPSLVSPLPNYEGTRMHQACMVQAMRSPEVRAWWSARVSKRNAGVHPRSIDHELGFTMPIQTVTRRASEENLTRDFRWAVLHFLAGDSIAAIAVAEQKSKPTIHAAVSRVMSLLPEPGSIPIADRPVVLRLRRHAEESLPIRGTDG